MVGLRRHNNSVSKAVLLCFRYMSNEQRMSKSMKKARSIITHHVSVAECKTKSTREGEHRTMNRNIGGGPGTEIK